LSLPLLAQLRNRARADKLSDRLTVMQMNAEDMVFADGQADIITGANILHHAVSPQRVLAEIRRVLRASGAAVFWEGFEGGAQIIAAIFDVLIEANEVRREKLPEGMPHAMRSFIADLVRRRGRSKPLEVLHSLDDKWYFTRSWISDLASAAGFSRYRIVSCYHTHNVVWVMVRHELLRFGYSADLLPGWAQEKILSIQDRYSEDWLSENLFEAAIVLEGKCE
jgi:SAM-dependent methyltransferase